MADIPSHGKTRQQMQCFRQTKQIPFTNQTTHFRDVRQISPGSETFSSAGQVILRNILSFNYY